MERILNHVASNSSGPYGRRKVVSNGHIRRQDRFSASPGKGFWADKGHGSFNLLNDKLRGLDTNPAYWGIIKGRSGRCVILKSHCIVSPPA